MTDEPNDLEYMRAANFALCEVPLQVMFDRMFKQDWGDDFYERSQLHLDGIKAEINAVHQLMDDLEPDDDARFRARRWREDEERRREDEGLRS